MRDFFGTIFDMVQLGPTFNCQPMRAGTGKDTKGTHMIMRRLPKDCEPHASRKQSVENTHKMG